MSRASKSKLLSVSSSSHREVFCCMGRCGSLACQPSLKHRGQRCWRWGSRTGPGIPGCCLHCTAAAHHGRKRSTYAALALFSSSDPGYRQVYDNESSSLRTGMHRVLTAIYLHTYATLVPRLWLVLLPRVLIRATSGSGERPSRPRTRLRRLPVCGRQSSENSSKPNDCSKPRSWAKECAFVEHLIY
jgi:hypothetical protein